MTTMQKVTRSKGLHGPLEQHLDESLCMDKKGFLSQPGLNRKGRQNMKICFSCFLAPNPHNGTHLSACSQEHCAPMEMSGNNLHITKEDLYFTRPWNQELQGRDPICLSYTVNLKLCYYTNATFHRHPCLSSGEGR